MRDSVHSLALWGHLNWLFSTYSSRASQERWLVLTKTDDKAETEEAEWSIHGPNIKKERKRERKTKIVCKHNTNTKKKHKHTLSAFRNIRPLPPYFNFVVKH